MNSGKVLACIECNRCPRRGPEAREGAPHGRICLACPTWAPRSVLPRYSKTNVTTENKQPAAPHTPPLDKGAAGLTPFMRQWTAAKRENPDALLFFRMGDFYETFYEDAKTCSIWPRSGGSPARRR